MMLRWENKIKFEDFEKISSSIWTFPDTTGSFWVQSLQTFIILSSRDFRRLSKKFRELGNQQEVLNMDIP
jgi:hypothetical protein